MINDHFENYGPAGISFAGRQDAPSEANWFQAYRDPQLRDFLRERGFSSAEDALAHLHTLDKRVGEQSPDIPVASLTPEQARLEIDRLTKDEDFMQLVYDETHPGHARAFQRYLELHSMLEPKLVTSLTPEQAQIEIDRLTKDETFMQLVYDETHPGHARAFQRYLELHAGLPNNW